MSSENKLKLLIVLSVILTAIGFAYAATSSTQSEISDMFAGIAMLSGMGVIIYVFVKKIIER